MQIKTGDNAHLFVHNIDICYIIYMNKKKVIEKALVDKRNEIIISLYHYQEYSYTDIAYMFKLAHTTVLRIIKKHGVV